MKPITRPEMLRQFSRQTIFFPSFRLAYSQLETALEATQLSGTASCAFVIGKSGTGKSTLCEIFANSFGPMYLDIRTDGKYKIIPALYCLVPNPVTIKGFCEKLLNRLGEYNCKGSAIHLTDMLIVKLKTCEVKVIILDEIQRLMKPKSEKTRDAALEWIVSLLTETEIPIMLAGTEICKKIFGANEPFDNRYCYLAEQQQLDYSDDVNSEYHLTLQGLDKELYRITNLSGGVHLQDPSIKIPLYVGSLGNIGVIRKIIFSALSDSLLNENPVLSIMDFKNGCQRLWLPRKLYKGNPFSLPLNECISLIERYGGTKK